jgi:acetylornithine deacetylase/succinyl-diaminopimelate desuccinylase-like protein
VIERIDGELEHRLAEISKAGGTNYVSKVVASTAPAPMDEQVTRAVARAAEDAGYSCALMPSGAFHDSLMLARSFPCGMIFIPSVNGVSHSPEEFSTEEDIQKGCDVLLRTVLDLDKSFRTAGSD